jgi:hypothetical protein
VACGDLPPAGGRKESHQTLQELWEAWGEPIEKEALKVTQETWHPLVGFSTWTLPGVQNKVGTWEKTGKSPGCYRPRVRGKVPAKRHKVQTRLSPPRQCKGKGIKSTSEDRGENPWRPRKVKKEKGENTEFS